MPDTLRRNGRPPLPLAPQNAEDIRTLIAQETVKTKPRERTLRYLYRLLKAFERADAQRSADEANRLSAETNATKREELALKRAEYQRRYALGERTKQLKQARG